MKPYPDANSIEIRIHDPQKNLLNSWKKKHTRFPIALYNHIYFLNCFRAIWVEKTCFFCVFYTRWQKPAHFSSDAVISKPTMVSERTICFRYTITISCNCSRFVRCLFTWDRFSLLHFSLVWFGLVWLALNSMRIWNTQKFHS